MTYKQNVFKRAVDEHYSDTKQRAEEMEELLTAGTNLN